MKKHAFPEQLIPIVLQTHDRLQNCFSSRRTINVLIHALYKSYGRYIKRYLNYDAIAEPFNQEFFFKNYVKALLFFYIIHGFGFDLVEDFFDVGSGATPGGIAYSQIRKELGYGGTTIRLLDKSKVQLGLAKKYCTKNEVHIDQIQKQTFQIREINQDSMVFFSYFVCEQGRGFIKDLYKHRDCFKHGFAVVDYQQNVERIERVFQRSGCYRICPVYRCFCLPESLQEVIHENEIFVNGCFYEPR